MAEFLNLHLFNNYLSPGLTLKGQKESSQVARTTSITVRTKKRQFSVCPGQCGSQKFLKPRQLPSPSTSGEVGGFSFFLGIATPGPLR